MKQSITLVALLMLSFTQCAQAQQGYKVTLKTPSYKAGLAYLTYHMGKNLNIQDSSLVNAEGYAEFKGSKPLIPGIYSIVFPGKNLTADFLVDKEQQIAIKADSADLVNMEVKGSKENILFQQYQKAVAQKGKLMQQARIKYNAATTKADSALYEKEYNQYNKELNDVRDQIVKEHPESMMAVLLKAMKEPEIPIREPKTRQDSIANYQYYKAHFWDGITFMDERVIRTPFFLPKLERYYRDIMPQAADSIERDLDYKLLLARTAPELYKFILNWATDEYINPKYMGQDAIFVHLYEKYHSKGISNWLNEKQMETITRRAYMLMANLIGEKAANLEMIDSTGAPRALYDLQADYTIVVFWDPTCGHCKEEMPKLDSLYQASWKKHNLKFYAVLNEPKEKALWVNYIKEHKLGEWTHVYATKEMEKADADAQRPGFRQLYDVTQTPTIYLLDKEKRIIGKKMAWKQINEFLEMKWKENK
jgi:thiol-disulfide isomerase/thioredoxin